NSLGVTPLGRAKSAEVCEALIAHGAGVSARDSLGRTPLHTAANAEVCETLIAHGADVNLKAHWGQTPLDEAVNTGNAEVAQLLIRAGARHGAELEGQ
ncbi:MAG: ankyrin repeat domain-containing protein, partial [Armatimonadota bacterium]